MLARPPLWFGAAAVFLVAGCATTRPALEGPDEGAVLEVVNRLPGPERVWVRERAEAVVPGGARARIRWLVPGPAAIEVTPLVDEGMGGEPTLRTSVELVRGQRVVVEVPGTEPLPPPLGELVVENLLAGPVRVSLDDAPLGTILADDTARYRDIPAGTHTVRAREADSGLAIEESVPIEGDTTVTWTARAPRGGVTIVNDGAEPVLLIVDARDVGRLEPGERLDVDDLLAGTHLVRVHGVQSRRSEERRVTVEPARRVEWRVDAPHAEVEVVNRTPERVILTLPPREGETGDRPRVEVELAPGGSHILADQTPGELQLEARGEPSGLPYRAALTVPAGQRIQWQIQPVRASVRVENATGRLLWVKLENTGREETLPPGATRMLSDLPVEPLRLLVVDRDRTLVLRRTLDPGADRTVSWRIVAPTGSVAVDNRSEEAVVVYADARRVGRVEAGHEVVLTGVPAGVRLLEAVGARTGHVSRGQRTIEDGGSVEWVVANPLASLVVTNQTGEPLLTEGVLAVDEARIAAGARALLRIPAGELDLRLVGEDSSIAWRHRVTAAPGEVLEWRVEPATGSLLVTNTLNEAMVITVDGEERGRIAARGRLSVAGLQAGRHSLRADGMQSGRLLSAERSVAPDHEVHWELAPIPARLIIFNESAEALAMSLDGRPYGRVEPRARQGFGALPSGPHEVVLTALRGGWQDTRQLTLADGATETIHVQAPGAVLVLANRSGERVRVAVDGAAVTEIAAGAVSEPLAIESGRRRVTSEGVDSGAMRVWRVEIAPSQTVQLEVPPAHARLVVVNQGASLMVIRVDGRKVGEVDPGQSAIVDDLALGEAELEATGPDGAVAYRERRVLEAGATTTWVLPAIPTADGAPQP
ncbi:MAG: hypothetical protein H6744_04750 [Deltaproteobacteria bacterium]|nr:hypothetical protein [Deltaproteobacteria bacterium]MCB9785985.1 hypothetical protein [Deltaproteobacteria bacterium]